MAVIARSRRLRRTPFSEGVEAAGASPDFGGNVAIGMVRMTHWDAGTDLLLETPEGMRPVRVRDGVWI